MLNKMSEIFTRSIKINHSYISYEFLVEQCSTESDERVLEIFREQRDFFESDDRSHMDELVSEIFLSGSEIKFIDFYQSPFLNNYYFNKIYIEDKEKYISHPELNENITKILDKLIPLKSPETIWKILSILQLYYSNYYEYICMKSLESSINPDTTLFFIGKLFNFYYLLGRTDMFISFFRKYIQFAFFLKNKEVVSILLDKMGFNWTSHLYETIPVDFDLKINDGSNWEVSWIYQKEETTPEYFLYNYIVDILSDYGSPRTVKNQGNVLMDTWMNLWHYMINYVS